MIDVADLVKAARARHVVIYGKKSQPITDVLADTAEAQAAEITRLRAACDAYFKTISLSQMRHGRILVGLELRNARQRRALAKLYQRRHDKNAALATARREGMEEAAKIAERVGRLYGAGVAETVSDVIRAAAKEGKP